MLGACTRGLTCALHGCAQEEGGREPQCCLCPVTGGALKPTTEPGLWCHAACMQVQQPAAPPQQAFLTYILDCKHLGVPLRCVSRSMDQVSCSASYLHCP